MITYFLEHNGSTQGRLAENFSGGGEGKTLTNFFLSLALYNVVGDLEWLICDRKKVSILRSM